MARVRIYLTTALAFWSQKKMQPLMLDSILGYWKLREMGYKKNPSEQCPENIVFPELPIEKEGTPGKEFYKASAMFVPKEAKWSLTAVPRRCDSRESFVHQAHCEFNTRDEQVSVFRGMFETFLLLNTSYIDFYYTPIDSTDIDEMKHLLAMLKKSAYLGGKRSAGYGMIQSIELHLKSEDWSVWKDGNPTRPIPVEYAGELDLPMDHCSFRPPYWYNKNKEMCYIPPLEQWYPSIDL